jgi:hypothetical protein
MLANMCHGGRIALLGIPSGGELAIDWNTVIFNMLTIKGIYGREMYETWYLMQSMVQTGLDISPVITHRFPIDQFEEAFAVMRSGNSGKVILDWMGGVPYPGASGRRFGAERIESIPSNWGLMALFVMNPPSNFHTESKCVV